VRGTDQRTERNVPLFDFVHRLGLNRGLGRLLGDLMITAAIPAITSASKSISSFWSCAAGFRCSEDSFSVFCSAIACSPPDPERTWSDHTRVADRLPTANEEGQQDPWLEGACRKRSYIGRVMSFTLHDVRVLRDDDLG
jgi:hypothetical protein